jgi:hypothetical protein
MPTSVTCACGKMFKVRDDLVGSTVTCQVCGAAVPVPSPTHDLTDVSPRRSAPVAPPFAPPPSNTIACPACAEQIPAGALRCPLCKEEIVRDLTPEQQRTQLAELLRSVTEHATDAHAVEQDAAQRGGFFAVKTLVLGGFAILSLILLVGGVLATNGEVAIVMGVILGLIFGLATLVSLSNDNQASHIQDAPTAEKAFRRYFMAMQTGRQRKAYFALAPSARTNAPVEIPQFEKLPSRPGPACVDDPTSFAEYVKCIFAGGSQHNRSVQLKKVKIVSQYDAFAVVEAQVDFSSYASLLLLTILINILVCAIVVVVFTKREKRTIHKLLIQHEGRWYIADPGFEGAIDRLAAKAAASQRGEE